MSKALSTQHSALSRCRFASRFALGFAPATRARRAFSMVELLIAIMILGIGLVMVATVFPVGLDMTRETVEESLAVAAAENAVEIVKLKVPTGHDEISNLTRNIYPLVPPAAPFNLPAPPTRVPVVLLHTPLVLLNDPYLRLRGLNASDAGIENDANIAAGAEQDIVFGNPSTPFAGTPLYSRVDDGAATPQPLPQVNAVTNPTVAELVQRTRALTETSFWNEDLGYSYVFPGQNVPVDYDSGTSNRFSGEDRDRPILAAEVPPAFGLGNNSIRLHLSELIYPPIPIRDDRLMIGLLKDYGDSGTTPAPTRWEAEREIARIASERRYSWSVIYKRQPQPRTFRMTVAVLTRGDLNARFSYQQDQRTVPGGPYNIGDFPSYPGYDGGPDDPTKSVFLPQPVTEAQRTQSPPAEDLQDGLFPRPWLVALGLPPNVSVPSQWKVLPDPADATGSTFFSVSPEGQAICTAHVARLVPPGSTIIFADTLKVARVLSSEYQQTELAKTSAESQDPARLQLDAGGSAYKLLPSPPIVPYVWVYPPSIVTHEPADFGPRSPVIAAFEREVTLP